MNKSISNNPIYWECKIDGHDKFWAAKIIEYVPDASSKSQKEYTLIRRWGSIGTDGQKMEQTYYDIYKAEVELGKLIRDKERKGYKAVF